MKQVIELYRGEYAKISRAEVEAQCGSGKKVGDFLIVDCLTEHLEKRLGYAKLVGHLGFCVERSVGLEDIQPLIFGSYGFEFHGVEESVKKHILHFTTLIENPVDLESPKTLLYFVQIEKQLLCIINPQFNTEKFEDRRMHLNPAPHPSSLHPRLARAMINLSGIESGEVYDPFCGAGGILIEAGLMGFHPVGIDIDPIQIKRAKLNFEKYDIKAELLEGDSAQLVRTSDYLITDIAYGKNTVSEENLITYFLKMLSVLCQKRAVIGIPSTFDYLSSLDTLPKLRLVNEFDHYLHKNLSKKILVIDIVTENS